MTGESAAGDWRQQRLIALGIMVLAGIVGAGIWMAIRHHAPVPQGMETAEARFVFAFKCCVLAALFTFVMGIEAVAHERLQSPAFDPLSDWSTRRLRVNQRFLQNTLEQYLIFALGLFGLAAYAADGEAMRAVTSTTATWILGRLAFWIGYHRSSMLRVLGAPGILLGQVVLFYVAVRIGGEMAGDAGAWAVVGTVLLFETLLFRVTRERRAA